MNGIVVTNVFFLRVLRINLLWFCFRFSRMRPKKQPNISEHLSLHTVNHERPTHTWERQCLISPTNSIFSMIYEETGYEQWTTSNHALSWNYVKLFFDSFLNIRIWVKPSPFTWPVILTSTSRLGLCIDNQWIIRHTNEVMLGQL